MSISPSSIARVAFLLVGASVLHGCAKPTEVELRLYPCPLMGQMPERVELDIIPHDERGPMPPLHGDYVVPPAALGDGYVTVGLRKPAGMVEAEFVLTWHARDGHEVVKLGPRPVPAEGEVLELGAEMCAPVDAGTGSSSGSTDDSTSTGSSTTSTGDTSSESSSSGSSSSGEGTTTTGDTSGSTGTSEGGSESTTTGEPSLIGDECTNDLGLFCENGGPKLLGTLLQCKGGKWALADLDQICMLSLYCPAVKLGLQDPVPVGCSGVDEIDISCVCRDAEPKPCDGAEVGCTGQDITLCVEVDGAPTHVRGTCATNCYMDADGPYCKPA